MRTAQTATRTAALAGVDELVLVASAGEGEGAAMWRAAAAPERERRSSERRSAPWAPATSASQRRSPRGRWAWAVDEDGVYGDADVDAQGGTHGVATGRRSARWSGRQQQWRVTRRRQPRVTQRRRRRTPSRTPPPATIPIRSPTSSRIHHRPLSLSRALPLASSARGEPCEDPSEVEGEAAGARPRLAAG
uniref:DUF834 domain-containing protein n=1 Tax=Oryza meridionalis TaxID=40149 RepID=A0A0E0CMS8_9ORYZ